MLDLDCVDVFDGTKLMRAAELTLSDLGTVSIASGKGGVASAGLVAPGFVDLQVNGGGGIQFNDAPSAEGLRQMAVAHRANGTVGFLPTLITDTPQKTDAAIAAVIEALDLGVPGVLGLHLEGPHIALARKGAHEARFVRPLEARDMKVLRQAAERLPNLMVTLAPEIVPTTQISELSQAGVIVALGHSAADYRTAMAAFDSGATVVTHLFNAMSPLHHREPGLVGAALDAKDIHVGLIADGVHVHPAALRMAAEMCDQVFLVTDAMAPLGTDVKRFTLNGRDIFRERGQLRLLDGTLAGADLTIGQALVVLQDAGIQPVVEAGDRVSALSFATSAPAKVLRNCLGLGQLNGSKAETVNVIGSDLRNIEPLSERVSLPRQTG